MIEELAGHCNENLSREEKLSLVLKPTLSKDLEQQNKLSHNVDDVEDRATKRTCLTLPRYIVDKPEKSYAQFRFFAWNKEKQKFQWKVCVNYKLEEFIFLLDVMKSVFDIFITFKTNRIYL